ncbi:unnamed protein product [Pleuronectes platessa]|uniref:Uncharacterized protein n=1 Tax=Pleuronectes platessa TaxID=8262 RepID=A0A9N7UYH5_PLEPL|nr:unnamed protein product [Pleuronectes platessa]
MQPERQESSCVGMYLWEHTAALSPITTVEVPLGFCAGCAQWASAHEVRIGLLRRRCTVGHCAGGAQCYYGASPGLRMMGNRICRLYQEPPLIERVTFNKRRKQNRGLTSTEKCASGVNSQATHFPPLNYEMN